jgi:hypothetical protein
MEMGHLSASAKGVLFCGVCPVGWDVVMVLGWYSWALQRSSGSSEDAPEGFSLDFKEAAFVDSRGLKVDKFSGSPFVGGCFGLVSQPHGCPQFRVGLEPCACPWVGGLHLAACQSPGHAHVLCLCLPAVFVFLQGGQEPGVLGADAPAQCPVYVGRGKVHWLPGLALVLPMRA